jgi:hypothetical protein
MSILDELRDSAEERLDQIRTQREIEGSAGRIAEGRRKYREGQAQMQRDVDASEARINAHREIYQAQQAGRISPGLADKRRARAAAAYESDRHTFGQKAGGILAGAGSALMREFAPRPRAPNPRPARQIQATRQRVDQFAFMGMQQPTRARQIAQRPMQHYDPFSFWYAQPAPKAAPKHAKHTKPEPARKQRSILDGELNFMPRGKNGRIWL